MKTFLCLLIASLTAASLAAGAQFKVACEAYTFNRFSVYEAIDKTAEAGAKAIEFYPGQRLTPEDRTGMSADLSDAQITALKKHLADRGVEAVSLYIDIPKNEAGARKVFEFAKKLGAHSLTTESDGSLDIIEKLVKEYDLRVGFHEHRKSGDANYKLWNPEYLRDLVKDRDPRIGACGDTGHWATSGVNPLDAIKLLAGRNINVHLKDRATLGQALPDVPLGTGSSDIAGILTELQKEKFDGYIILEYEANFANNVPDVKQCLDFIHKFEATGKP